MGDELETLYMGGGTPSLMSPLQLERVVHKIGKHVGLKKDCEFTVEMDPGTFDAQKLRDYKDLGVSRISMGLQTFNEVEFNSLGRGHVYKQVMESIEEIFKSGFDLKQVSIDLMMGIPHQTLESYRNSLEKAVSLNFGHLSFYILTLEKGTPFQKAFNYDVHPLPHNDSVVDMYGLTHEMLSSHHYDHYEISNYGKGGSKSRHNQMYWAGDTNYLAFGCGSASFVNRVRFSRPKQLKKYYNYVEQLPGSYKREEIETDSQLAQTVLMCGLRKSEGINPITQLKQYFPSEASFTRCIEKMISLFNQEDRKKYFQDLSAERIALT